MPLTTGVRLGSYEIRAPLGRGGVGEVYRAWDPRLEREVALKILHERSEIDPDRVWRFVAEARAASALNHPNILSVFDAAVEGATPYIVSELIEGDSLRSEIQRGPVPLRRLLDLATQIADGLSHAHAAGIVHRDLKPENIMVTRAGRAKILDFGLARTTGFQTPFVSPGSDTVDGQTVTEPGLLAGTIPYMSPEQARGNPTDFRTDQFSFGLVLYEMVTGRPAFRRATPAQTLEAITSDEPAPLTALNARAPLALRWIIERCLAKDSDERYGITSDLHRDLRMLRDRLADAIAPESEAPPPAKITLRRRILFFASMLAAVVAGALLWAAMGPRTPVDSSTLRFTPFATEARYEAHPALSPNGQTIAYVAEVDGVLQVFARSLTSSSAGPVTDAPFDCKYPFWSPDGTRIYYVSRAKTRDGIWSVGAAGGTPQVVVENALRGAISPDGRTLAFLRDEDRADIVGTAALYLATPEGVEPWSSDAVEAAATRYTGFDDQRFVEGVPAFSPDGRTLGLWGIPFVDLPIQPNQDPRFFRFWVVPLPVSGGRQPSRRFESWSDLIPRVSGFTWIDNRHVVFGVSVLSTPGTHLWMGDVGRDRVWPLTRSADSESFPSSSPNSGRVVFSTGESDYDLVELSTSGEAVRPVLSTGRKETDPAWSADGTSIAYVTDRRGQDEIWLRSRDGQQFDQPLITQADFADGQSVMLGAPVFSPNGQRIAYLRTGGRVGGSPLIALQIHTSSVAASASASPAVRLLPSTHESFQSAPTWSPDGQWIAFAEWKGRQQYWDLVKFRVGSGEEPIKLRADGVPNATPQWSPKGDWLTWETGAGFVLVSPDGKQERRLEIDQWLVHAWSRDASSILGIVETDDRPLSRLSLVSVDVKTGRPRALADLGPSPPVNNPVQGFSVGPDGHSILTSLVRMRGDLWLLEGLPRPESLWDRLLPSPIKTP